MSTVRVLIVDDEPLVRRGIAALLALEPEVQVLGEARNGSEALTQIRALRPDLVFLDVQMPGLDGLGVLASLEEDERPAVVFVTAFDQYAVRAFDLHAVDYLLKPFDDARFRLALGRARDRLRRGATDTERASLSALLAELRAPPGPDRLAVREQGQVVLVPVDEIDWIEAADNYVRLHRGKQYHLLRESLNHLETTLDPRRFARIHRSAMVNLTRVRALEPVPGGEYDVILTDGRRLTLSRGYRDKFYERFRV
ncbi:MAG: LytTR family DNA-binding domain-containing protein [Gemmatimonadales bacterium]